jgi:hypothetical protein
MNIIYEHTPCINILFIIDIHYLYFEIFCLISQAF